MQGDFKMLRTVLSLASICSIVHSSGVHHAGVIANAPVVTAASSQYFERTFNRLVAAPPVVPVASGPPVFPLAAAPPVFRVAPAPAVFPVASAPPVFVQAAQPLPALPPQQAIPFQPVQPVQRIPVQPEQPTQAQPNQPVEPNVSIAIATANAAAPVATILLPPYPFGFPPGYGFIPQEQPSNVDEKTQEPEQTTTISTTQVELKTTTREPESTTPLPAASDLDFSQVSPSNQNVNFKQYLTPAPPQPQGLPSNENVNFKQYLAPAPQRPQFLPSNQNVNINQYLARAPQRPQALPSNQNVNFRQYLAPAPPRPQVQQQPSQHSLELALPQPLPHHHHHHDHHHHGLVHLHPLPQGRPHKLKTVVEVVKAPLAYIGPPPVPQYPHNHEAVKVVKHIHSFIPTGAKLIIRPVSHHHTRSVPVNIIKYKAKNVDRVQNVRAGNSREVEFTTFRSYRNPNLTPPKK